MECEVTDEYHFHDIDTSIDVNISMGIENVAGTRWLLHPLPFNAQPVYDRYWKWGFLAFVANSEFRRGAECKYTYFYESSCRISLNAIVSCTV